MDEGTKKLCSDVKSRKVKELSCSKEGILKFNSRLYITNIDELRCEIIEEAYCSTYAIHSESTKMYRTLKESYWWREIKGDIAESVSKYLTYQ